MIQEKVKKTRKERMPLPADRRRSCKIACGMRPSEAALVERAAERAGLPVPEWVRDTLLATAREWARQEAAAIQGATQDAPPAPPAS